MLALLLAASVGSATAAEDPHDCIAIARVKSATLAVDGKAVEISNKGVLVDKCGSARFQKSLVRLHFVGKLGVPIVDLYDSKVEDDGHQVSERVTIAGSIGKFLREPGPDQNKQVPAGQYAAGGLFTIRKAASGDFYALIVDPSSQYAKSTEALTNLTLGPMATTSGKQLVKLDGQPCGVVWGLINCSKDSTDPSFKAFMTNTAPDKLTVGDRYFLSAKDKPDLPVTFVPPAYLNSFYQSELSNTEGSPTRELRRILLDLSIQSIAGNQQGASSSRAELQGKFPQLVPVKKGEVR